VCGLWPQCGHLETTQAVRLKSGSSRTLLHFLHLPGCGENYIRKFSCFNVRVGACCTGLPAGLPIKENPGEPGFQSAASDAHRHTSRWHNLNYTIWTLSAESVSSHQGPFTQGHALLPGARPFQSIKQLWARPDQQGRPLFNLPRQTETHPLPLVKRNQETRGTHLPFQKQQWRLILACLARIPISV
jgi:hypothetical protein